MKYLILFLLFTQSTYAINLNLFKPSQSYNYSLVESAQPISESKNYFYSAFYQYVNKPIVSQNSTGSNVSAVVSGMNILNFSAARIENKYLQWGISSAAIQTRFSSTNQQFSMADSSIYAKYFFPKAYKGIHFSLMPQIYLPTGKSEYFTSDSKTAYEMKFVAEKSFKRMSVSMNLGYMYSPEAQYLNLDYRSRMLLSLGIYVPVTDKLGIAAEITTSRTLPFNNFQNPGEVYTGARYRLGKFEFLSGISFGNINNNDSNNFSFTGGFRYTPLTTKSRSFKYNQIMTKELLRISDQIYFAQDSYKIKKDSIKSLERIVKLLKSKNYKYNKIILKGYTNKDGEQDYNKVLSFRRANAIKEYFVNNGIKSDHLHALGLGEIADINKSKSNKAKLKDRKVEFIIE